MKLLVKIGDRIWSAAELEAMGFDCRQVEPGVYSLLRGNQSWEVRVWQNGSAMVVELPGGRLEAEVVNPRDAAPRRASFGAEGRQSVSSPMPGKVVRLLVELGDQVEFGQGLVVVEAMKMQNELKAPKAGKVVALPARVNASVNAGEILVTLE
ncbi:MAG: biotin/lipoyl-binding protein [Bryobacteraceae bacterium]|nr:biotin/lipoyl-binding protein [Bryobacteraceae bacterium]MDW8376805.1 biotin/lipoyl-containing protein [Bryobacterales bacterium]